MISTFNLTKLDSLLCDFYTLTKIRITIFDDNFNELTAYPRLISPFCQIIRRDPAAQACCRRCDQEACAVASHRHMPYIYRCHSGLTEAIAPLYMGNIVVGYLLFGHLFSYPDRKQGWNAIKELCSVYDVDMSALKEACDELPQIDEEYIHSAAHILQAVASYLCMERIACLKQQELPVKIDNYIQKHYTEKIDAKSVSRHFQIGKTYLYEIARENYGMGIAEYIRNLRIKKAQEMLAENPEMRISEVASACGFDDYNYFITVFKKLSGMPPKKYREAYKQGFV